MKISALFFFLLFICCRCTDPSPDKVSQVRQRLDSLEAEVTRLRKQIDEDQKKKDSIAAGNVSIPDSTSPASASQKKNTRTLPFPSPPKKEKIKQQEEEEAVTSTFYYYKNPPKRVSVEITSWMDGKRKVIFFDPFGKITYTCDDTRLSYSLVTTIKKFHDNGAVDRIQVNDNPGASLYWYETLVTFSINNEPQWKTVNKFPHESLEESTNKKYWWNEKTSQWVQQEIVQEQPVPAK